MNRLRYCYFLLISLILSGCTILPTKNTEPADPTNLTLGHVLQVQNTDEQLTLRDYMDILAADGLYYATWTIRTPKDYQNSDGDTVDLYDAQLYLLSGEAQTPEDAKTHLISWENTAKANYQIQKEWEATFNGQTYTLITYHFKSPDTPYARGISAFTLHGSSALCVELTCQASFSEDLESILANFLNNCHYISE